MTEENRNGLRDSERKMEKKFHEDMSALNKLVKLYKSQIDKKLNVDNLSKGFKDLQNKLEKMAKQQENTIKDQNRNMMDELKNMGKRVSDVATSAPCESSVELDSLSKSQLTAIITYLREEKDRLIAELEPRKAEIVRLKNENVDVKKELEEKTKSAERRSHSQEESGRHE